ncbi:MAG: M20 family metallopeptidase [Lachnospirales bacterium]
MDFKDILEQRKDEYLGYLKDLVSIDTQVIGHGILGGLEKEGQLYLEFLANKIGANSIVKENLDEDILIKANEKYSEGNLGHNNRDRYNLLMSFNGKSDKTIIFNGHIDTMPPGDETLWSNKPHTPTVKDGKLYGLGVCDMKSGLMASILAVKLIKDVGEELPVNVKIASVANEEGGGNGSIVAAMNGLKGDCVIVCEPTTDNLYIAHMGFIFYEVTVKGKAIHSGSKEDGINAVDKAIKIINELYKMEERWQKDFTYSLLPKPSLNVGVIEGGVAASTTAESCSFKVCIHYLPQIMSREMVVNDFENSILEVSKKDEWLFENPPYMNIYQAGGSFEMEKDHRVVDVFKKSYNKITGKEVVVTGCPAGCDSRIWKNIANCPTIQFGPGRNDQCHTIDEHIDINQFYEAILIYADFILNFC